MNKTDSIAELAKALAKAQGEIENASKNAANPHFKSKYADLAEVLNTVRPVFSSHGLSVLQMPSFDGGIASVETLLMHTSGEWISNTCSAPVSKNDAQGVGSAITYLRRYSLAAFAGIAQEDDDANSAVGHNKPQQPARLPAGQPLPQSKPQLPAEQLQAALQAVRDGKRTPEQLRAKYALTDEQDNALHALSLEAAQ